MSAHLADSWWYCRAGTLHRTPLGVRKVLGRLRKAIRVRRRRLANTLQVVGLNPLEGPSTRETVIQPRKAPSSNPAVPVVLLVWRRPHRLAETLALLEAQEGARVELYIWNNAPRSRAHVDSIARNASRMPVHITHSSRNVGGFGRFYIARALAASRPFAIFIDDDQRFTSTMVSGLLGEARPKTISGYWAFHLQSPTDYWARTEAAPGDLVDYCGTGGMVADTRIFLEPAFFDCPRRYWFIEDIWMSYFAAHVLGWELRKSAVAFELSYDGLEQFVHLRKGKSAFIRYLVKSGWELPRSPTVNVRP